MLEHIGKSEIDDTLQDISSLTQKIFFYCIDFSASKDERWKKRHFDCPSEWWVQNQNHFNAVTLVEVGELEDGSKYQCTYLGAPLTQ